MFWFFVAKTSATTIWFLQNSTRVFKGKLLVFPPNCYVKFLRLIPKNNSFVCPERYKQKSLDTSSSSLQSLVLMNPYHTPKNLTSKRLISFSNFSMCPFQLFLGFVKAYDCHTQRWSSQPTLESNEELPLWRWTYSNIPVGYLTLVLVGLPNQNNYRKHFRSKVDMQSLQPLHTILFLGT